MANGNSTDTLVKYVNKDFQSFKRDLINYAQAHFSGSYQDFNEASPGMMILELQAYIGDVLAFYMDQQFLEIRQNTARQLSNIEELAKLRGYKPKGVRAASVTLDWIVEVPGTTDTSGKIIPDPDYLPILRAGSVAGGPAGTTFETLEDMDFASGTADNPPVSVISRVDGSTTYFAVKRKVDAVAGKTVTDTPLVTAFQPFYRLALSAPDVQSVIDVYDQEGNRWFEVQWLAQNAVFDQVVNQAPDSGTVPYVLKYVTTGRRFMVDQVLSTNTTYLQFGPGGGGTSKFDDELIPNVANLALPLEGRSTFTNFTLDPQNFLKTSALGQAPVSGTRFTVRYRTGGGVTTNVPARSITRAAQAILTFRKTLNALDPSKVSAVQASIEVTNILASEGGGDAESSAEIKSNAASFFAAQNRCVTREDFVAHVLSMPAQFGRPEKVYVKNNEFNPQGVDLHILSLAPDLTLQKASTTLKQNIATYLSNLRMLTEGITILDTWIVNLGVNFGVVISPLYSRTEVLANCIIALKSYFDTNNMSVGMPLVRSDVESVLQAISGVISVYKLEFSLKFGAPYSEDINFDIEANTKNGILYCPENTIFEVKYPDNDIVGESK